MILMEKELTQEKKLEGMNFEMQEIVRRHSCLEMGCMTMPVWVSGE